VSAISFNAKTAAESESPALIRRVTVTARRLVVEWRDGEESALPFLWLRDSCLCPFCRDPRNGQRLVDAIDLPIEPVPRRLDLSVSDEIGVEWLPDGHLSRYTAAWLAAYDLTDSARARRRGRVRLWGWEIVDELPRVEWSEVTLDAAAEWRALSLFKEFGFVLFAGVPTESGMVTRVGDHFGHVRVTNYGRHFDVVSLPNPDNLAYTEAALAAHTDNPYRDPAPGVQLLHCLEADAPGGDSILVDGFRLAEEMRRADPAGFELLTRLALSFRFANATADLAARAPVIALDCEGQLVAVHFNSRSADAPDMPAEAVESWYAAYRRFANLLRAPEGELRLRLDPGDLLMMSNARVLHGRTAFDASLGRRHLQGCYIDIDGVLSRLRLLSREAGG